jgi:glycerol kinase
MVSERPAPGVVLALDQGSHASRAVVFDASGSELAHAHVPVTTRREGHDRVEHDPEEIVRSLRLAAEDALEAHGMHGRQAVAAGLATQRSTIVCWDRASGRALSEAISWQDRRNANWLARLRPAARRVREITGLPLSPHYGASKLRWCLEHLPDVRRAMAGAAAVAGPLSSFLTHRLARERPCVTDPANASRTLLFDPAALDWSIELLDLFGIPRAVLPACVPTRHAFGHLVAGGSDVPLVACTGDQSAAAFAFGQPSADTALVNVGTGAFIQRVVPDGAPLPDGLLRSVLYADTAATVHSHEGTVNGAAAALDWLRGHVALDVDRALARLPAARIAGAEPPLFINGVGGLGAPFWIADFPVEFVGDGSDDDRLVAVIESIVFLLHVNLEALRRSATLDRIRITGGLARCDYLCRALADLSGLVVERYLLGEATARGVAFLAAGAPASWSAVAVECSFAPCGDAVLAARYARWRGEMARRGAST